MSNLGRRYEWRRPAASKRPVIQLAAWTMLGSRYFTSRSSGRLRHQATTNKNNVRVKSPAETSISAQHTKSSPIGLLHSSCLCAERQLHEIDGSKSPMSDLGDQANKQYLCRSKRIARMADPLLYAEASVARLSSKTQSTDKRALRTATRHHTVPSKPVPDWEPRCGGGLVRALPYSTTATGIRVRDAAAHGSGDAPYGNNSAEVYLTSQHSTKTAS